MKDMQELYNKNQMFYWCNCQGEINHPGDNGAIVMHSEDDLPAEALSIYQNYWTESVGDTGACIYLVQLEGKFGLLACFLIDCDFVKESLKSRGIALPPDEDALKEQMNYATYALAEKIEQSVDMGQAEILFGPNTDPDGDEIALFVDAKDCARFAEIVEKFVADTAKSSRGARDLYDVYVELFVEQVTGSVEQKVFGDYVLTPVKNAFNNNTSWWISKRGFAFAAYAFSGRDAAEIRYQTNNISSYIKNFDLMAERFKAGARAVFDEAAPHQQEGHSQGSPATTLLPVTLVRQRECEHQTWVDTWYLQVNGVSSDYHFGSDEAKALLLQRIQCWLTSKEGWSAIVEACRDYNWGDFTMNAPLPAVGIYDKPALGTVVLPDVAVTVAQDELIAPSNVDAVWVAKKGDQKVFEKSAVIDFTDGTVDVDSELPFGCVAEVVLLNGDVIPCDSGEDGFRLSEMQ